MTDAMPIDTQEALAAFERRDRAFDGRFVVAVRTTKIYCRPSCPARRPHPDHVAIFADPAAARAGGYRACHRCLPDAVARDRAAVARATAMIAHADAPVPLAELAAAAGYAPHHFHRLFKRATGVTPAAFARALRRERAAQALHDAPRVTDAIYDAGYAAPSRFYAEAGALGMTPAARRRGGRGETIRWTIAPTSLGPLLLAATGRGLAHAAFGESDGALRRHFPAATIEPGDAAFARDAARRVATAEGTARDAFLPAPVRQHAFLAALRRD